MHDETPTASDAQGGGARIGPDGWSGQLAGGAPQRARSELAKGETPPQTPPPALIL